MIDTPNEHKNSEKIPDSRRIWQIAGPAILANSSAPLVGLVDTWAIGHLPDATHLAAIGAGAAIFTYLFWGFGFLRMGTTGLIAQAFGRTADGDIKQLFGNVAIAQEIIRASFIAGALSIAILLLQSGILVLASTALAPPENVLPALTDYFDIRIWAAPATLFVYIVNGYLIGTGQAKAALVLQLVLNISNGALNLIFVLGFDMGVSGIALGTLIAEWLTLLVGLFLIHRTLGLVPFKRAISVAGTWQKQAFRKIMGSNSFLFVRTLLLMTALTLVTREAAKLGDASLAASHVLSTYLLLISLGLDAFAYAAEALAGSAFGKRDKVSFRKWTIKTTYWAVLCALFYSVLFWLGGSLITGLLTDLEPIRVAVASVLPIMILMPLAGVWCYQFDGIFIGATASAAMAVTMAIAFVAFLGAAYLLTPLYGLKGLWGAVLVFMIARGASQAIYYPWLEQKIGTPHLKH